MYYVLVYYIHYAHAYICFCALIYLKYFYYLVYYFHKRFVHVIKKIFIGREWFEQNCRFSGVHGRFVSSNNISC